ncbi:hypothetical protein EVJ58_g4617 [Rhodofomes roseus]|uniref:Uncharacterized protein n=1 Tax=Rhodofomes roseus TaxID=34475 RepID=A0A4Y9YGX9_9APHY|nr:hypothetical protein EVJ58_g4617 [Rhodofomes roseus]
MYVSQTSSCEVYACLLRKPRGHISKVVCKVTSIEEARTGLEHEAAIYQLPQLAALRGRQIPDFFGIFSADVRGIRTTCIVLEYGGEALDEDHKLEHQYRPFREATVRAYEALHLVGVYKHWHPEDSTRQVFQRHILMRPNGEPCLVDFTRARKWHDCTQIFVQFDRIEPGQATHMCTELYHVGDLADAWYPAQFTVSNAGKTHDLRYIPANIDLDSDANVQQLLDRPLKKIGVTTIAHAREVLRKGIERYEHDIERRKRRDEFEVKEHSKISPAKLV